MKRTLFSLILLFPLVSFSIPRLSQNVMVSGPSELALESALRVSKEGGNPVDAAVAYGLTLAVTHPYFGSLGGGGFALVKTLKQKAIAVDFRERAPLKTHEKYFVNSGKSSTLGGAAVGVPGFAKGLWELHKNYGKLAWKKLFKEALFYSKKGFPVSSEWYEVTKKNRQLFWPGGVDHLLNNGRVPLPGDTLKQKGLYKALLKLKKKGPKSFYEGDVAQDIVDSVKASGGDMSLQDLKNYKVVYREPLKAQFKGNTVYLMPPPSSGGIVIKTALELVERSSVTKKKLLSVGELNLLSQIMSKSFRGRSLLGDPAYVKNPIQFLTSDSYLKDLTKSLSTKRFKELKALNQNKFYESTETTHFVVMNNKGEAVSLTVTLNGNYGSKVISKKYGIALNNEMDDFTTKPNTPNMFGLIQGKANFVQAGKRPLSSMSPTLVEKNGRTIMALGAPGGPRIINAVFQTLYRSFVSGLDMEQAIYAPRLHHQFLPRITFYEKDRFSPNTLKELKRRGHKLKEIRNVAVSYGVKINNEGLLEGAGDFRREAFVGGY